MSAVVLELPPVLDSLASLRVAVLAFEADLDEDQRQDLLLVGSELLTNAIRHAGAREDEPVRVRIERRPGSVRIEVRDGGPGFDLRPRTPGRAQLGGRGMFLLDQLSDRWGVSREDGFLVWGELWTGDGRTRHRRVAPRMLPVGHGAVQDEPDDGIAIPEGAALAALQDEELKDLLNLLADEERSVSARRRNLHRRIDPLRAELARRLAEPREDAVLSSADLDAVARMLDGRMPALRG
jgi:anti-sigma regulatory factor (Ser/Thr protein kinase)